MTTEEKNEVIQMAREEAQTIIDKVHDPEKGEKPLLEACCSVVAYCLVDILESKGLKALFQAGSAFWRRVPEELDDGKVTTFFGYQFHHFQALSHVRLFGSLPEMHCWAVVIPSWTDDPRKVTIIDPNAGAFPAMCKKIQGEEWLTPLPPDYYWGWFRSLPKGTRYEAHPSARKIATAFIESALANEPFVTIKL